MIFLLNLAINLLHDTVAPSSTMSASLERLVPLVKFLPAWKALPNISQWVVRTVDKGYRLQFGSRPPKFMGVLETVVGPKQAQVMEQEVQSLLAKEAIDIIPPPDRNVRFCSLYFIVPKKAEGLLPIIDLSQLN